VKYSLQVRRNEGQGLTFLEFASRVEGGATRSRCLRAFLKKRWPGIDENDIPKLRAQELSGVEGRREKEAENGTGGGGGGISGRYQGGQRGRLNSKVVALVKSSRGLSKVEGSLLFLSRIPAVELILDKKGSAVHLEKRIRVDS